MISKHYHHIKHYKIQKQSKKTIYIILVLTLIFALIEFFGGLFSGSLSLIGDSFHMFSDVLALVGSAIAIYFASKKPNDNFTFGYLRLESIIALLNGIVLMLIPIYLAYEAFKRFFNPIPIDFVSMSSISIIGLIFNIVTTCILYKSVKTEHNLNIQSALWHFLGDLLNSVALIISAFLIYLTSAYYIDIIMSLIVCVILFIGGYQISKKAFLILMDYSSVSIVEVRTMIERMPNIENIHDLHIWSSNDEEHNAIMHILLKDYNENSYKVIEDIKNLLIKEFKIHHSFIVVENIAYNKHLDNL